MRASRSVMVRRGTIQERWRRSRPSPMTPLRPTPIWRPACRLELEARLFRLTDEPLPPGWLKVDAFPMLQMVMTRLPAETSVIASAIDLTRDDISCMMELAQIAKPGPFGPRTIELGSYVGVRDGSRLVAMAGERMRLPGYVELSAIATHPEARGRGLAGCLTLCLAKRAMNRGETAFLHVRPENTAAVSLYQRLGFENSSRALGAVAEANSMIERRPPDRNPPEWRRQCNVE